VASFSVNLNKFKKSIDESLARVKRRSDTNAKCVIYVDTLIQKNFRSEGMEATGSKWIALSPKTLERRRKGKKKSNSALILQDIGNLKNDWKRYNDDEKAYIESGVDYGWTHERGSKKMNIPKRKILPTHAQIWPGVQAIYKKFLGKVLK
jgi:phage gpG-like protein